MKISLEDQTRGDCKLRVEQCPLKSLNKTKKARLVQGGGKVEPPILLPLIVSVTSCMTVFHRIWWENKRMVYLLERGIWLDYLCDIFFSFTETISSKKIKCK